MQGKVHVLIRQNCMMDYGGSQMPWTTIDREPEMDMIYGAGEDGARVLSYADSIREALMQAMTLDERVFLMGQGINDKSGMFGTTTDLYKKFDRDHDNEHEHPLNQG